MKLVGADRDEVGVELPNRRERELAEDLHGIGVKNHAARTTQRPDRRDRLERAEFVVGGHDRDERRVGAQGAFDGAQGHLPGGIHRQVGDREPLVPLQILKTLQHRVVLDGRGDQVVALGAQMPGGAEDREVVALGAAAGENHLARLGPEHGGDPVPGVVQQRPRPSADLVNARRVAPDFPQKRQHRLPDRWIERRGGVVIEINRRHGQAIAGGGESSKLKAQSSRKWPNFKLQKAHRSFLQHPAQFRRSRMDP